jgi:hypothetical protein
MDLARVLVWLRPTLGLKLVTPARRPPYEHPAAHRTRPDLPPPQYTSCPGATLDMFRHDLDSPPPQQDHAPGNTRHADTTHPLSVDPLAASVAAFSVQVIAMPINLRLRSRLSS